MMRVLDGVRHPHFYLRISMFRFIGFILVVNLVWSGNALGSDCPESRSSSTLAVYISRYPISTIRINQDGYLTPDALKLAWQDYEIERKLACLSVRGGDFTTSAVLSNAEDNAAIYLMYLSSFPPYEVTEQELRQSYEQTSPTYAQPASAKIEFYFLQKRPEVTSTTLVALHKQLVSNSSSTTLFTQEPPAHGGVTTGSAIIVRGKLNPAIEDQAFSLPVKSARLFQGEHGWYIIWVSERNIEPKLPSFEDVRNQVKESFLRNRHERLERNVRNRVESEIPIRAVSSPDFKRIAVTTGTNTILTNVGRSSISVGDVLRFAEQIGTKATGDNWEKLYADYRFRRGLIELSKQDGLTSSCLYSHVRDMEYHKKLAALAIEEEIGTIFTPVSIAELLTVYQNRRKEFETGKKYGVLDFWTTAPTSKQYSAKDELYLKNEQTKARMQDLRNAVNQQGLDFKTLPRLSNQYGPFQLDDTGVQPQGPRGYLLDTTVQNLKVGEVSPVVADDRKYHFYILKSLIPSRPLTFEEAKPQLKQMLEGEQREKLRAQLIEKYAADVQPMPDDALKVLNEDVREQLIQELMDLK